MKAGLEKERDSVSLTKAQSALVIRCRICREESVAPEATRICNKLNVPLCAEHAYYCDKDGHGSRPIEADVINTQRTE